MAAKFVLSSRNDPRTFVLSSRNIGALFVLSSRNSDAGTNQDAASPCDGTFTTSDRQSCERMPAEDQMLGAASSASDVRRVMMTRAGVGRRPALRGISSVSGAAAADASSIIWIS